MAVSRDEASGIARKRSTRFGFRSMSPRRSRPLRSSTPTKTKTEIVGDLLAAAVAEAENAFPPVKGPKFGPEPDTDETLYEDVGMRRRFRSLANEHYRRLERELGNEKPEPLYDPKVVLVAPEGAFHK